MPYHTPELTEPEVLQHAYDTPYEHLPLHAEGYTCTTADLLKALLGVAGNRGTIEPVCADSVGLPDPQTIRGYLTEHLGVEDLPELERCLNAALATEVPPQVRPQAQEVAIDYPDRPYYGKAPQAEGVWVRGQAKDGTTRFYRIATASVVLNGLRVTLAIRFVLPQADTVTVLGTLLTQGKAQGRRVACLLLDKGVASLAVMAYLTGQRQPALSACTARGTTGGTRALCRGRQSYRTAPTFRGAPGRECTAAGAAGRGFTTARRTQRVARRAEGLLFILLHRDLSPRYARQLYRGRFGIETTYRCAGRVRGWTTANHPAYRFVLIALAFLLLNVWVHLRWLFTPVPRRGRRWLDTPRFQLARFTAFMRRALEQLYGCIQTVTAPAMPRC